MSINSWPHASRRDVLLGGGALLLATKLPPTVSLGGETEAIRLRAAPATAPLLGADEPSTSVWAYNASVPGPLLRVRQGESARLVVENALDQDTTVHWHGIRVPNAMDGVPGLTQPPILPGEIFTYDFVAPDAGTYWYHPHANSLQQIGRGLAGVLIVDEPEPVAVDRDVLWVLGDWRLTSDAQIAPGFGSSMEAVMSGRVGNTITLNGTIPKDQLVRAGERIRLRLVNTSLARIMALRFVGHRPMVIAIDGQPCDPHEAEDGRVILGPAMRVDVGLDLEGEPGKRYAVVDDYYEGLSYTLTSLAYDERPPLPDRPLDIPLALPRNPLPEPDLAAAQRQEILLQGGMMGGGALAGIGGMGGMATPGMNGEPAWAINGMSMTGDGHAGMQPIFTLKRGQTCVLSMRNETAWWHPMHIHGFSPLVVQRNGKPVPHRQWQDTILMAPKDTVECAFVADKPGDWMLHCHVTDHQMAGLMTVFRVD